MKAFQYHRIVMILAVSVTLVIQPELMFSQNQNPKGLTREQIADIHGRFFRNEEAGAIPNRLARETGDIYIHAPGMIVDEVQLDTKNQLANWMRHCDLVAFGKVGTGMSYMTAGKGFLNTDWDFVIEEVVKNNPKAYVSAGTTITVITMGGKLKVGERSVFAIQRTYREFRSGEQYLLFLKFVPETGAYSTVWPMGFSFSGSSSLLLAKQQLNRPDIESMDKDTLITTVKVALGKPYS